MNDKLYVSLTGNASDYFPLGLTISHHIDPIFVNGYTLFWTLESLAKFELIKGKLKDKKKNLPFASLRGLLKIYFDNLAYLDNSIKLKYTNINSPDQIEPFAYLSEKNKDLIKQNIKTILNEWIINYLTPFVKRNNGDTKIIEQLQDLWEAEKVVTIDSISSQILPWKLSPNTETTCPNDTYSYRELANFIAKKIAGKEIFQGCGPMKRIISSNATGGEAELMTDPISLKGKKGQFSLLIKLEIVTFPSVSQPVLKIDVSKRRWLNNLKEPNFNSQKTINGYIFSNNYPEKTFNFKVISEKNNQGKLVWNTDDDFAPLQRKFNLNTKINSGEDIALGKLNSEETKVMLTYREGLNKGEHGIKSGILENDKLEAFEKIYQILQPFGFIPFQEKVNCVKCKTHKIDESSSSMIKLSTLLETILQKRENTDQNLSDNEIDNLLQKHFELKLKDIYKYKRDKNQSDQLAAMINANNQFLTKIYPNEELQLIIFYQNDLKKDAELAKNIAQIIWGNKIEIKLNRLPKNVHSPRKDLAYSNLSNKERSKKRIEEWSSITEQLKQQNKRNFCLILAKEWYENGKDDNINKPSTRKALASLSGSLVQFLLPINKDKKGLFDLSNYFLRVQSALKDLISAHSGRLDHVPEKVNKYLENIAFEKRPQEIITITIVRKQRGRERGKIEQTFLLIATKLNVETEICEIKCAYDQNKQLKISPWFKFADGLGYIANISPVKLANNEKTSREYFAKFLDEVISESVNNLKNPFIIIDSSNCVKIGSWLSDVNINTQNIEFKHTNYDHMECNWKGARIIRVRQDIAPGFINKKVRRFAESFLEDTTKKKDLICNYEIPYSSSPTTGLFRLETISNTGCLTYFSIGLKRREKKKGGYSCYREVEVNQKIKDKNQAGLQLRQIITALPYTDKASTPNPLEIVVTLRQEKDNPDDLAAFVESLRYDLGHYQEWSSLPAPLFFERVVRDYLSDFSIQDEEEMDTEDDDNDTQLSLFD